MGWAPMDWAKCRALNPGLDHGPMVEVGVHDTDPGMGDMDRRGSVPPHTPRHAGRMLLLGHAGGIRPDAGTPDEYGDRTYELRGLPISSSCAVAGRQGSVLDPGQCLRAGAWSFCGCDRSDIDAGFDFLAGIREAAQPAQALFPLRQLREAEHAVVPAEHCRRAGV